MADRRTMEQRLKKARKPVPERAPCPVCGRSCWPFEIVAVDDVPGVPADEACSRCLVEAQRDETYEREKTAREKLPDWERPDGVEWKARRDRMLDKWRWTIAPDSPLSSACQQAFKAYLFAWHRMAIDSTVKKFKEPELPLLEYATLAEHKRSLGL